MAYIGCSSDIPFSEEDELTAIETFEDGADATRNLIDRLIAIKKATGSVTLIRSGLDNLEELVRENPTQDYAIG